MVNKCIDLPWPKKSPDYSAYRDASARTILDEMEFHFGREDKIRIMHVFFKPPSYRSYKKIWVEKIMADTLNEKMPTLGRSVMDHVRGVPTLVTHCLPYKPDGQISVVFCVKTAEDEESALQSEDIEIKGE